MQGCGLRNYTHWFLPGPVQRHAARVVALLRRVRKIRKEYISKKKKKLSHPERGDAQQAEAEALQQRCGRCPAPGAAPTGRLYSGSGCESRAESARLVVMTATRHQE